MRICFDLTSLSDNLSGIERYAACISLEMINAHNDDYILVFKKDIHHLFKELCNKTNVKAIVLPECHKFVFYQIRLPMALHKISADWYIFLAFPVPILSFKRNMIETVHDITAWDFPKTMKGIMNWYFKISHVIALKKCRAIITISEFSKKRIHERLKYPCDKILLTYCGINQEHFVVHEDKFLSVKTKYNLPDKYILSLSTLEPRKNLQLLIRAYEKLVTHNKFDIPLVLAGRKGWKMEQLLSSIDDKVKDNLFFTGFVDDEDLPEVYAMADFFVFPSIYEGFGLPPLEAMSCGTLVISSDAASLPEVLGDAAIYFRSNDIDDLQRALLEAVKINRDVKENLIVNGFEQIRRFDWMNESEKLYSVLMKNICS